MGLHVHTIGYNISDVNACVTRNNSSARQKWNNFDPAMAWRHATAVNCGHPAGQLRPGKCNIVALHHPSLKRSHEDEGHWWCLEVHRLEHKDILTSSLFQPIWLVDRHICRVAALICAMDVSRLATTRLFDKDSWLFVHDSTVHSHVTADFGYHCVSVGQAKVLLDWNQVFVHQLLFVSLNQVHELTRAY